MNVRCHSASSSRQYRTLLWSTAASMLVHQRSHTLRPAPARRQPSRGRSAVDLLPHSRAASRRRGGEAVLGPIRDAGGQQSLHGHAVEALACARTHAGGGGDPLDEAHQLDVEERNAQLEARGHGHLVVAQKNSVGQEHARVQVERLFEQAAPRHVAEHAACKPEPLLLCRGAALAQQRRANGRVGDLHQAQQPAGVAPPPTRCATLRARAARAARARPTPPARRARGDQRSGRSSAAAC